MTGQEILDKIKSIKGEGDESDPNTQCNRAMAAGFITGGLFGLYYGYSKQKNMITTGIVFAVGGLIVSRLLVPTN